MIRKGTDFYDKEAFNLMAGADEWFSPVFAEVGPDGAVWVADWYSFIIQHNPVPKGFDNGSGNAYETDLRDYTHGRIYRVSYKYAAPSIPRSLSTYDVNGLLNALRSDNMFWRMHAQRMLVERKQKDVASLLKGMVADKTLAVLALAHDSAAVALLLKYNLLNDSDPLVVMNALLHLSKSPITDDAEKAFFDRLHASSEVDDRWLPDAFACVLTANGGKLMNKHLQHQLKNQPASKSQSVDHSMHAMQPMKSSAAAIKSTGVDLIISDIKMDPSSAAVRERVNVTVEVKNIGTLDLPADKFVPLDIRFEGMGLKFDQVSRNYKEGIKAGETVSITKNINGPWVGNISFGTDIVGDYRLSVVLDKSNEIKESNKNNNWFEKKVSFVRPPDMNAFALERALRSYASVAPVDSLVAVLRKINNSSLVLKNSVTKAFSEGWNYQIKNTELKPSDKAFLSTLAFNSNERLKKLLVAWNAVAPAKSSGDVKVIRIKTIREAMKYDLKEFTVSPGQTVQIVLENNDAMQHNLVVTRPGMREKVGKAGDAMMKDDKGAEKNYVPSLPEVLFATPLVNPGQSYTLTFKAPAKTGDYPYVCTFPGHWTLMNGVMHVK
ncbi:MAG: plastocyanin/azurin family copper-binding protein [Chitinophagaceae bacterium]|nr:plastocyanin/azurin family copper-binding protein [Chitinophagaceae bacterium]